MNRLKGRPRPETPIGGGTEGFEYLPLRLRISSGFFAMVTWSAYYYQGFAFLVRSSFNCTNELLWLLCVERSKLQFKLGCYDKLLLEDSFPELREHIYRRQDRRSKQIPPNRPISLSVSSPNKPIFLSPFFPLPSLSVTLSIFPLLFPPASSSPSYASDSISLGIAGEKKSHLCDHCHNCTFCFFTGPAAVDQRRTIRRRSPQNTVK